MNWCKAPFVGMTALALALPLATWPGWAGTIGVTYYTVAETGDPDFNTSCCFVFTNLVRPRLGPHGLPVLNPIFAQRNNSRYVVHDVSAEGELGWWTPGPTVASTGTRLAELPLNFKAFFPPNGTGRDNAHGFQTAVFRGVLHVPATERVSFHVGADDAAFVYLDGELVADLGGVHRYVDRPVTTRTLEPGDYCLELFYADLFRISAELHFSIETADVSVSAPADRISAGCAAVVS